jgi:enoyl-CoA hydratase
MIDEIDISTDGALGLITLNRPDAINALSLGMIEAITATLRRWRDDPAVTAVLFRGNGSRGFCSGGDVRHVRLAVVEGRPQDADAYFAAEYGMNRLIAEYPKPLVALTHGVVMGGGIGIAGHCRFRLTLPGARYAMPESAIGLFADVGVNAILAKAPLNRALLFLLSGVTVGAADAVRLGLADAVIDPDWVTAFPADLVAAAASSHPESAIGRLVEAESIESGDARLCDLADQLPPGPFESPAAFVDAVATVPDLVEISRLFATRCPASLVATFFAQHQARRLMDVALTLEMDLRLAAVMARRPDFAEGVRAVLVDKDQSPKWSPSTLLDFDEARDAEPIVRAVRGV